MELVKPETKDLWFRKELLADEETMSFNLRWGGAIEFSEDRWAVRLFKKCGFKEEYRTDEFVMVGKEL